MNIDDYSSDTAQPISDDDLARIRALLGDYELKALGINLKYDDNQARDERGRWTDGGGGGGSASHSEALGRPSSHYTPVNAAGKDTEARFKGADGKWTPERVKLHDAILAKYLKGHKPQPSDQRVATVLGGGPASGKSTIVSTLDMAPDSAHIDVDQLRTELPEYKEMLAKKDAAASTFTHEEASYLSKRLCDMASEAGMNILLDGTGDSSYEALAKKVGMLKKGGHKVVGHYVTVDTDEAWRRSEERGKATGRYVPESYLREVHANVSRLFPEIVKRGLFDELTLWDSQNGAKKVASAKGTKLIIHDKALYEKFLAKGNK